MLTKFGSLFVELFQSFYDSVSQLDIFAAQFAEKLDVVVAGNAEGVTGSHHLHDKTQNGRSVGAAVDEVAEKNGFSAGGGTKSGGSEAGWLVCDCE